MLLPSRVSVRFIFLCAGTEDRITREDVLLAGGLAEQLVLNQLSMTMNDQAQIAVEAWQAATGGNKEPSTIARCLKATAGGRNLAEIGHANDIPVAAAVDMVPVLPELNRTDWRIRL